jgi:hypothetical protein
MHGHGTVKVDRRVTSDMNDRDEKSTTYATTLLCERTQSPRMHHTTFYLRANKSIQSVACRNCMTTKGQQTSAPAKVAKQRPVLALDARRLDMSVTLQRIIRKKTRINTVSIEVVDIAARFKRVH